MTPRCTQCQTPTHSVPTNGHRLCACCTVRAQQARRPLPADATPIPSVFAVEPDQERPRGVEKFSAALKTKGRQCGYRGPRPVKP